MRTAGAHHALRLQWSLRVSLWSHCVIGLGGLQSASIGSRSSSSLRLTANAHVIVGGFGLVRTYLPTNNAWFAPACISSMRAAWLAVLFAMSFAAALSHGPRHVARPRGAVRGPPRNSSIDIDSKLDLGERVQHFLVQRVGEDESESYARDALRRADEHELAEDPGSQQMLLMPYGFWKDFVCGELHLAASNRSKRILAWRSWLHFLRQRRDGCKTREAMRGERPRGSMRSNGGALNAQKARGLGFMLFQFFVDEVQKYSCRADSQLLMEHARNLREQLIRDHWEACDLPKLIGNAGKSWFCRWRVQFNIVHSQVGMKLKVSWSKVVRRVRVLMRNVFRLRALWVLLFPTTRMRWLSVDQKPSWFNNAGHTGALTTRGSTPTIRENFSATRERYTILTSVPSWGHGEPDVLPKVAVLFKGKPGGRIVKNIQEQFHCPEFMMVQVQEHGSYRSEDVVTSLDWMLPSATCPEESIVVMLDWYSGHRTDEVLELLQKKGHVLLFHGGGTTPFTQVNDTHLHARVQRLMVSLENEYALAQRKADLLSGKHVTPTLKRSDILLLVKTMWECTDHAGVAAKGYMQTGPEMALEGPIRRDDVFADLAGVLDRIGVSSDPVEMCTHLRDEAVAYVRDGYDSGKWTGWADCHKLIEEQDTEDDPLVEGMEGFAVEPCDSEDDHGPENDDDLDDHGGGGDGGVDNGSSVIDVECPPAIDVECPLASSSGVTANTAESTGHSHVASAEADEALLRARRLLYEDAKDKRDDVLLRHLRQRMAGEKRDKRDEAAPATILLRKRGRELNEAEAKRRKEELAAEGLAANATEQLKLETARAQERAEKTRLDILKTHVINRREQEATRRNDALKKAYNRWLQTTYPCELATRLMDVWRGHKKKHREMLEETMRAYLKEGRLDRPILLPQLWEDDNSLTTPWTSFQPPGGGQRRSVRMSVSFLSVVEKMTAKTHYGWDPADQLLRLLTACSPAARQVFTGQLSPLRLFLLNECVFEKAFIFAIIVLSNLLGPEKFPEGIYGEWPPAAPASVPSSASSASSSASPAVMVEATAPIAPLT